ncbi:MAG: hypothetical protein AABX14_00205 [Candidatus Aenigmatarchaeota archaeon]
MPYEKELMDAGQKIFTTLREAAALNRLPETVYVLVRSGGNIYGSLASVRQAGSKTSIIRYRIGRLRTGKTPKDIARRLAGFRSERPLVCDIDVFSYFNDQIISIAEEEILFMPSGKTLRIYHTE